ncbi:MULTISPECIES: hypothetical protein [Azotobacter]|nr:hypothetical protein [Azotobacter vinelandii]
MKKSLLALAVAALSANAFAFELGTDSALKYASEIKFDTTDGTELTLPAGETVDVETGFSITAGNVRYVRFDITGAEFDTSNVAAADLVAAGLTIDTEYSVQVSAVDSTNKKYVIFEITPLAAGGDMDNEQELNFSPKILAKSAANVTLQYRLYETGVAALAGSDAVLASKSGSVISFAKALSFKATPNAAIGKIDVAQESKLFTTGNETDLGTVEVALDSAVLWTDGLATEAEDLLSDTANANSIVISGDFSSATDVQLAGSSIDPDNLTATTATFPFANAASVIGSGPITFITNETDAISPSGFTTSLDLTAATNSSATDISGGALGSLEKNGDSKEVNLSLKPKSEGGVYDNFVRISNTSSLAGKFFITVIADDGSTASLALSDVEGQPAELAARASTTQMRIDDIYAAAVAKGFALSGQGKLRLVVEGEVPSLDVQTYTVSKDANSFATF